MSTDPAKALVEAIDLLDAAQSQTGVRLGARDIDHIWHIVVSHHGRWGKIQPETPEAVLVHECDVRSATCHRCTPIDASDILPLLDQGLRWQEVAARLRVGTSVVRDRLREACRVARVADVPDLLAAWRMRGYVVTGSLERMRQFEEAREVVRQARLAPASVTQLLKQVSRDDSRRAAG